MLGVHPSWENGCIWELSTVSARDFYVCKCCFMSLLRRLLIKINFCWWLQILSGIFLRWTKVTTLVSKVGLRKSKTSSANWKPPSREKLLPLGTGYGWEPRPVCRMEIQGALHRRFGQCEPCKDTCEELSCQQQSGKTGHFRSWSMTLVMARLPRFHHWSSRRVGTTNLSPGITTTVLAWACAPHSARFVNESES